MEEEECLGCKGSDKDKNFIFQTEHWRAFLHPDQAYLGRSVVVLKRHTGSLSCLSPIEVLDHHKLLKQLENSLWNTFSADPFNWCCLMDNAYQELPYNPHVHWHLRPRYKEPVEVAGMIFEDPEFGHHYMHDRRMLVSEEIQKVIIDRIRENLDSGSLKIHS